MTQPASSAIDLTNTKVVFTEPFGVQFQTEPLTGSLQEDQILIETEYSLISPGTELALYTGTHVGLNDPNNLFAKYPFYPGYASVGKVVEVGGKVQGFNPGDYAYTAGPHAKYTIASAENVNWPAIKISCEGRELLTFARLAAISMTSLGQSDIRIGHTVVVLGMGLVGNLAAQLFSIMGAEVIGVDVVPERLEIAAKTGIERTILSGPGVDLSQRLGELTTSRKADIVVEATGSPKLVEPALDLVKDLGQVIALGSTRGKVELNVYEYIHRRGVRFSGAHEMLQDKEGFPGRLELTRYVLRLIALGALKIPPLLTHRLAYSEAKQGYDMLVEQPDKALGILLCWKDSHD